MFFAYGKPWFVAGAYAINQLLSRRPQTAQSTSFLYRCYSPTGTAYGDPLVMTQELADRGNADLAKAGSALRWRTQPPSTVAVPTLPDPSPMLNYRLFDVVANKFVENDAMDPNMMISKEVADEANKKCVAETPRFRWIQIS